MEYTDKYLKKLGVSRKCWVAETLEVNTAYHVIGKLCEIAKTYAIPLLDISIGSDEDFCSVYADYYRDRTEEELEIAVNKAKLFLAERQKEKRAQYQALKKEFGD